jgi:hypothetical protein
MPGACGQSMIGEIDDWRNQAISRFDRQSVSAMAIFHQSQ